MAEKGDNKKPAEGGRSRKAPAKPQDDLDALLDEIEGRKPSIREKGVEVEEDVGEEGKAEAKGKAEVVVGKVANSIDLALPSQPEPPVFVTAHAEPTEFRPNPAVDKIRTVSTTAGAVGDTKINFINSIKREENKPKGE